MRAPHSVGGALRVHASGPSPPQPESSKRISSFVIVRKESTGFILFVLLFGEVSVVFSLWQSCLSLPDAIIIGGSHHTQLFFFFFILAGPSWLQIHRFPASVSVYLNLQAPITILSLLFVEVSPSSLVGLVIKVLLSPSAS